MNLAVALWFRRAARHERLREPSSRKRWTFATTRTRKRKRLSGLAEHRLDVRELLLFCALVDVLNRLRPQRFYFLGTNRDTACGCVYGILLRGSQGLSPRRECTLRHFSRRPMANQLWQ